MTIDLFITMVAMYCNINNTAFTKSSKEDCIELITNCSITYNGRVTTNNNKLEACIDLGQRELRKVDGFKSRTK